MQNLHRTSARTDAFLNVFIHALVAKGFAITVMQTPAGYSLQVEGRGQKIGLDYDLATINGGERDASLMAINEANYAATQLERMAMEVAQAGANTAVNAALGVSGSVGDTPAKATRRKPAPRKAKAKAAKVVAAPKAAKPKAPRKPRAVKTVMPPRPKNLVQIPPREVPRTRKTTAPATPAAVEALS